MKVVQSCPTLCNLMDSTIHRLLQARIMEWVALSFSRGSSQPRDRTQVSCIAGGFFTSWATREAHLVVSDSLATPWTVNCQASLSMEFSRQEYWSGLPCPPPGDLPNPGMEIRSPASQVDSLPTKSPGKPNLVASPNPSGSSSRHRHVQILLNLPSK